MSKQTSTSSFSPKAIRTFRERAELTQERMIMRLYEVGLPITRQTLASWESGDTTPGADDLPKLAQVLGCAVADFYDGKG